MSKGWLAELGAKMAELQRAKREAEAQLRHIEGTLAHFEAVYAYYSDDTNGMGATIEPDFSRYAGLSQRETVFAIMDDNDHDLFTKEAAKVFKLKVSTPANAASALFSILGRLAKQGEVLRVAPGHYRRVRRVEGEVIGVIGGGALEQRAPQEGSGQVAGEITIRRDAISQPTR